LIKHVYPFKKYNFRKMQMKFSNINCKRERLAPYKLRFGKQQVPIKGMKAAY